MCFLSNVLIVIFTRMCGWKLSCSLARVAGKCHVHSHVWLEIVMFTRTCGWKLSCSLARVVGLGFLLVVFDSLAVYRVTNYSLISQRVREK